jgi:hypothetical protein
MTQDEAREAMIEGFLVKADQALAAARRELAAGDLALATNRVYYACFYALSAVLLSRNLVFAKHAGLRAAMHQHLVRPGELSAELGRFYDEAFAERQAADYTTLVRFEPPLVSEKIDKAERFVAEMKRLLGKPG